MPITGLHLLQTYKCPFECDHCFLFSRPQAKGTMTIPNIREILNQAKKTPNIEMIFFEGGEPFLYYQTMLWGLRTAKNYGFKTGIVTNAYWATSLEDAKTWLTPISAIGISALSISDDAYHYSENEENLAKHAYEAAQSLNLPVNKITIENPKQHIKETERNRKPVTEGKVQFKGRAVEKLTEGIPTKPWTEFNKCLDENFANQTRVHIDPFGYVHVCQGITIGNINQTPLPKILTDFNPQKHPICAPILQGGPTQLIREYNLEHAEQYVDECHLCYTARLKLRNKFPNILTPDQIYGT